MNRKLLLSLTVLTLLQASSVKLQASIADAGERRYEIAKQQRFEKAIEQPGDSPKIKELREVLSWYRKAYHSALDEIEEGQREGRQVSRVGLDNVTKTLVRKERALDEALSFDGD